MKKNLLVLLVTCLVTTIMIGGCSNMQSKTVTTTKQYPDKPITLIVPSSAGSGLDVTARTLEKVAFQHLGQPLVIVNKPGGGSTIGWNELSAASPDGYTIGITAPEISLQPLYGPTKYNYLTALEPLAQVSATPLVMVVQTGQPWQSLDELISYAKEHPGQIKYGHWGIGALGHIIGETFAKTADITLEQVPFRGGGEALTALLGGHIQVTFLNPSIVKEHLKNGTIKALAITGEQRLTDLMFAQVLTFKEQGLDVPYVTWHGIGAPKGLPPEVKTKLAAGLKAIISDPEFQQSMEQRGVQIEYLDPKETEAKWLSDSEKLTQAVQETGILERIKAQKK